MWIFKVIKVINKVSGAIEGIAAKIKTPAQRKIAKLEYRIEAAMSYVAVNERIGQYADFNDKKIAKYLVHFRKRIHDV